jgi:hypothetical protein
VRGGWRSSAKKLGNGKRRSLKATTPALPVARILPTAGAHLLNQPSRRFAVTDNDPAARITSMMAIMITGRRHVVPAIAIADELTYDLCERGGMWC